MKAVLLVGGEGTRLRPLTLDVPKPLLPIAEVPYLEQLVHYLSKFGVSEMILTSCYLSEQIREFCSKTRTAHFKLTYVLEESPRGTGGAVANVEDLLEDTFLVLNGDILSNFDLGRLIRVHREKKGALTLALTPVSDPSRYGVADLTKESRIKQFIEKPRKDEAPSRYINAGMYIVEPDVLKLIPKGEKVSIEREIFPRLAAEGGLFGCVMHDYWLDMGTPSDYLQVHYDFLEGKISLLTQVARAGRNWLGCDVKLAPDALIVPPVLLGDGAAIGSGATVGPHAVIGKLCRIEPGASVARSVLWNDVHIGRKGRVERSIFGSGVEIKEGRTIEDQVFRSASIKARPVL